MKLARFFVLMWHIIMKPLQLRGNLRKYQWHCHRSSESIYYFFSF